ncbi:hypothetical protein ACPPVT_14220 [Angustibacter sp. McL0619]|uniref:hypothetical protein n=1 Tax=Angustibacter sp. McL0619 TaxID=3415676 RepID=UPI003CF1EA56
MTRIICMVLGHDWAHIRAPGSTSSRDFYNKCLRCGRVDENPRTFPVTGGSVNDR